MNKAGHRETVLRPDVEDLILDFIKARTTGENIPTRATTIHLSQLLW